MSKFTQTIKEVENLLGKEKLFANPAFVFEPDESYAGKDKTVLFYKTDLGSILKNAEEISKIQNSLQKLCEASHNVLSINPDKSILDAVVEVKIIFYHDVKEKVCKYEPHYYASLPNSEYDELHSGVLFHTSSFTDPFSQDNVMDRLKLLQSFFDEKIKNTGNFIAQEIENLIPTFSKPETVFDRYVVYVHQNYSPLLSKKMAEKKPE